ncbi:MAG: hypothetical protein H0T42_23145 [Deltaproteobacteria bacterium]|nr:hypothetical protein [Deltaproteobacteria bacterium]
MGLSLRPGPDAAPEIDAANTRWTTPEPEPGMPLPMDGDDPTLTGDRLELFYNVGDTDVLVPTRSSVIDA